MTKSVCVHVSVCVREREREKERDTKREKIEKNNFTYLNTNLKWFNENLQIQSIFCNSSSSLHSKFIKKREKKTDFS